MEQIETYQGKVLNDEQREVVEKNMGYAESIALNYKGRGIEIKDLCQVAYLALCEAVLRYDETSGATIVTYSTLCINGFLHKYILKHSYRSYFTKGQRSFAKFISLDKKIDMEEDSVCLLDVIDSEVLGEKREREMVLERVDNVMKCLTPDDIILIESRFRLNGDNKEFERLRKEKYGNISERQLYRKCDEIISKMAEYAEKENL